MNRLRFPVRHSRLLMVVLTLGAFAMIAAVWWYYTRQREAITREAVQALTAITAMKSAQIENWRAERLGDGRTLRASPVMRTARDILLGVTIPPAARAGLMNAFEALQLEFRYTGVALVDLEGHIRVGSEVGQAESLRFKTAVLQSQLAGDVILSDLYRDGGGPMDPIRMVVAVPVARLGAVILNIDPWRFLYPYIGSFPSASRSGETVLVRRDGDAARYLSDLRFLPGSALNLRRRIPLPEIPDQHQLAPSRFVTGPDYRGVLVMAIVRSIQRSPWYLFTKIDVDEVHAPLNRLSWELTLIVGLIALANSTGIAYLWRNEQLHAHRQRKALTGHFDSLARYANDIIFLADDDGRIIEANQRATQAYGYSGEEMQSLHIQALLAPGQPQWRSAGDTDGVRYEALHQRKDGSTFPVDISSRVIEVEGRRFHQGIIRDISERVRTEREIKALSARLIGAQEEERARIARELHDDFSQQVAALSIGMSNLKRQIPAGQVEAREQSERIQGKLVQISESIRRLSHELHPAILEYSGLGAALSGYCSEFTLLTHISVICRTHGAFDGVPSAVALCVYRITQEALQNVAKHARVREASVELTRTEGTLTLTVSDRGAGMELNPSGSPAGLGLVSIKERARLVNGTLEIRSRPNQGTTLDVKIAL